MNEFETINQIVENSIRNSSYVSVLISSGVFIIYLLIIKITDFLKAKDRNKPFVEMTTAMKDISANVTKLNSVLDKTLTDAERKETTKCRTSIKLAFDSFQNHITRECVDMIINNHIESNKELIIENITKLVNTEYYKIYSILSNYEINGVNVAARLDKKWIDECIKSITTIMYNGQETVTRIAQLSNRLSVDINNYSTYVENKTFNV